jgi:hypothetical protein
MAGDRVTLADGSEGEFLRSRSGRAPRVVSQRYAVLGLVGGLVAGGGGVYVPANQILRASAKEVVEEHNKDPQAHAALVLAMKLVEQSSAVDDAEKARLQQQLDALAKDVRETHDAVIRLEAQVRRGGR